MQSKKQIEFHCPEDLGVKNAEEGSEEDELCKRINRGLLGVTDSYDINQQNYGTNAFVEKKQSKFGGKRKQQRAATKRREGLGGNKMDDEDKSAADSTFLDETFSVKEGVEGTFGLRSITLTFEGEALSNK